MPPAENGVLQHVLAALVASRIFRVSKLNYQLV